MPRSRGAACHRRAPGLAAGPLLATGQGMLQAGGFGAAAVVAVPAPAVAGLCPVLTPAERG